VTVQLFAGSSIAPGQAPLQSVTVNAVAGSWSATVGGLSPGTYTLRAEQSDEAGNVGTSSSSTFEVTRQPATAGRAPSSPTASFTWFPASPRVGESVSIVSSSTDPASPIISYAWDLAGDGSFAIGGPGMSTTFATPGNHLVQLRVTNGDGISSLAASTIPVGSARLTLMQPFPVVRIASSRTSSGVKLKLLLVLASPDAQITVTCKGRRCPVKSQSHLATAGKKGRALIEFRRFERSLSAGVTLEIRITRAGEVGKYTRLYVRRGHLPLRSDACLSGLATKPIACPSS
jgi:PKD domain